MASQIDDCNPIILTEIITGGYLDGLTVEEIIAFVSIFTEPLKKDRDNEEYEHNFTGTPAIHDILYSLEYLIKESIHDESNILQHLYINSDWTMSYGYIDIAYGWATGMNIIETAQKINEMQENAGSFIRNMLKIAKICNTIQYLSKLANKIELIPLLEKTNEIIMRDIVALDSILFNS